MKGSKHRIGDVGDPIWHISPTEDFLVLLEELGEGVLAGPGRSPDDYEVDEVFAKSFDEAMEDFALDAGIPRGRPLMQSIGTPMAKFIDTLWHASLLFESTHDEFRIVDTASSEHHLRGVVALQRRASGEGCRILGTFTGVSLAVEQCVRGLGIGKLLAMARMIQDEALPTWNLDKPAYSTGGAQTILSAARELCKLQPALEPVPMRC